MSKQMESAVMNKGGSNVVSLARKRNEDGEDSDQEDKALKKPEKKRRKHWPFIQRVAD